MEPEKQSTHNMSLEGRKQLEMNGVKEVISFNESKIILQTNLGILDISGKDLNIQKLNLDDGGLKIEGYVNSLEYSNKTTESNFFKRLFK